MGAGAKRADADLLSLEPFDVFYFRFRVQPVHGPVETNKNKFKWSAAGNRANDAGTARDEVDVAPKQRDVGHSRSHGTAARDPAIVRNAPAAARCPPRACCSY